MAYRYTNSKGEKFYLHAKTTIVESEAHTTYSFERSISAGVVNKIPEGFEILEAVHNGMPVLARKGADGQGLFVRKKKLRK